MPASFVTVHDTRVYDPRLLYHVVEETVRPTHTLESLLNRILELTLYSVRADRGCFLLKDSNSSELTPVAYHQNQTDGEEEQLIVSRTITSYVLRNGQTVRTSDAVHDTRFGGKASLRVEPARRSVLRCGDTKNCWVCCMWTRPQAVFFLTASRRRSQ